jgi:hypothetical protein
MRVPLIAKNLTVSFCLAVACTLPACTPTHHCPKGYDLFGPYTLPLQGRAYQVTARERGFIWAHWQQRRPCCAQVTTTDSAEGVRCTNLFIVEPDRDGRWHIIEDLNCGPGVRGLAKPAFGTWTWYSLQRVPLGGAGWRKNKPLPDTADAAPDSYLFRVNDLSGRKETIR